MRYNKGEKNIEKEKTARTSSQPPQFCGRF